MSRTEAESSLELSLTIPLGQQTRRCHFIQLILNWQSTHIEILSGIDCLFNSTLSIFGPCPDDSSSLTRFLCPHSMIEPFLWIFSICGHSSEDKTGLMTNSRPIVYRLNLIMLPRPADENPFYGSFNLSKIDMKFKLQIANFQCSQ